MNRLHHHTSQQAPVSGAGLRLSYFLAVLSTFFWLIRRYYYFVLLLLLADRRAVPRVPRQRKGHAREPGEEYAEKGVGVEKVRLLRETTAVMTTVTMTTVTMTMTMTIYHVNRIRSSIVRPKAYSTPSYDAPMIAAARTPTKIPGRARKDGWHSSSYRNLYLLFAFCLPRINAIAICTRPETMAKLHAGRGSHSHVRHWLLTSGPPQGSAAAERKRSIDGWLVGLSIRSSIHPSIYCLPLSIALLSFAPLLGLVAAPSPLSSAAAAAAADVRVITVSCVSRT